MLRPKRSIAERQIYIQTKPAVNRRSRSDRLVAAVKAWKRGRIEDTGENRQPAAKAMPPRERARRIGLSARSTDSHRRVIGLSARGTDAHPPRPETQDLQHMRERKRKREAAYLEAEAMHAATTIDVDECLRLSLHTRGLSPPTPKGEDEVLVISDEDPKPRPSSKTSLWGKMKKRRVEKRGDEPQPPQQQPPPPPEHNSTQTPNTNTMPNTFRTERRTKHRT